MKKIYFVVASVAALSLIFAFESGSGGVNSVFHTASAPPGYAGDPAGGNKTCNTIGCHTGPAVQSQAGWITSNIPVSGYVPGTTYTITATATRANHVKFGFEVSPQSATGVQMGTMASISSQTTINGLATKYITHNSTGTSGAGFKTWSFNWTAPGAGSGAVNFYGAFNITNASNNAMGDTIFTSVLNVIENTSVGISNRDLAVSDINVYPNPVADFINVKFNPATKGELTIQLIDVTGKLIANLMNENIEVNEIEKNFDISSLNISSGVYYLSFNLNNTKFTKRILVN